MPLIVRIFIFFCPALANGDEAIAKAKTACRLFLGQYITSPNVKALANVVGVE